MEFSQQDKNAFLMGQAQRNDLGLWDTDISAMSGPLQVFRLVWELEAEVNNGGFQQYFINSSGEGAPHCAAALREIGAQRTASLIDQAIAIVGAETDWLEQESRDEAVSDAGEGGREKLNELDQAFFRYDDNLTDLLFQFVIRNIGAFPQPK